MSTVGEQEILTQRRVVEFFREALGYSYLGNWKGRPGNRNIEKDLLAAWLKRRGFSSKIVKKALDRLDKATVGGSKTLYDANREMYGLLRYGVKVQPVAGEQNVTVGLIDWKDPFKNDFAVAEEVTVTGENSKRPDVVLYVNGIAFGVLELKRSTVSVTEGIRQNLDSQKKEFIRPFFATVQILMSGNETEGLRYGVIETPEKYWLSWKESETLTAAGNNQLLRDLGQICAKERLLEIVHDFIVFDAGVKKICRHNQYFGVRAAQKHVKSRRDGIIWHTQGSGKSLTMVWLAKWIREHELDGRVLIITDRTELDEQIEKVFKGVSEDIYRTDSGADLVQVLNASSEWLICSLIHKFGPSGEASDKDMDSYLEEIRKNLPENFRAKGTMFVFVDECHRTQSGKLHDAMKDVLPDATLIGFTGTPLLRDDKKRSVETFGPYIHTYKYDEAVRDGVVLDLAYEARDIDQNISSQDKIDQWFETKTRGLNDIARARLKRRWGTMQNVMSSIGRLQKIVADILLDMATRDRLQSGRGNAMLIADSIYSAFRFFEMFQRTELAGKCAVVTSYRPTQEDVKGEETGEGLTEKQFQYESYRRMLAAHFNEPERTAMHKTERFESEVKKRFVDEPGQMKLLIVVDKLLTGFNAPPATYLYIDKSMRDHGLFQAICRVNRLDGEDKQYGYIVDYKDLFRSLERSIEDYTGEAFDKYDDADVKELLKNRLAKGREKLEEAREAFKVLCEPVEPPRDTAAHLRFFCASKSGDAGELKDNEPKRVLLYKLAVALIRAYANLANEMKQSGYSDAETREIMAEVDHCAKVREEVRLASGDYVDMKIYEPPMRHLFDTYIRAEESEKLSAFEDMTLVQLVVNRGEAAVEALPNDIRENPEAVAETIENNIRRLIVDKTAVNPRYYEKMSELLDNLILQRKREAADYKAHLAGIIELAKKVSDPDAQSSSYPSNIRGTALRSLYDNLEKAQVLAVREQSVQGDAELGKDVRELAALAVDRAVRRVKKADWRGNTIKEREIRNAIKSELGWNEELADKIFGIVKAQSDY